MGTDPILNYSDFSTQKKFVTANRKTERPTPRTVPRRSHSVSGRSAVADPEKVRQSYLLVLSRSQFRLM